MLDEFRVADLRFEADAAGGDLGVEHRRHHALAAKYTASRSWRAAWITLARARRGQGGRQRLEAADPQRVDAPDLTVGRELQQA